MADKPDDTPLYTNFAKVMHNGDDFFFDLAMLYPSVEGKVVEAGGKVHGAWVGRYVMSPALAKLTAKMLHENIQKYEETHGVIEMPTPPKPPNAPGNISLN